MVETSESPWNRRIFFGGNPGFLGQTNGSLYRDSLILLRFHVAKHTIHGSSGYRSELIFFSLYQLFFWGENRSTHVGPSKSIINTCVLSFLQTRGPTIMRWVKPLCGAVTEIQSLNILRIQPLHMVAWRFVQYTPPGVKKKTGWELEGTWHVPKKTNLSGCTSHPGIPKRKKL